MIFFKKITKIPEHSYRLSELKISDDQETACLNDICRFEWLIERTFGKMHPTLVIYPEDTEMKLSFGGNEILSGEYWIKWDERLFKKLIQPNRIYAMMRRKVKEDGDISHLNALILVEDNGDIYQGYIGLMTKVLNSDEVVKLLVGQAELRPESGLSWDQIFDLARL